MIPRQMKLKARRAFYDPPFSLGPYAALSLSLALYEPPLLFGSSKARVAFAMARLGVDVLLCAFAFPFLITAGRQAGFVLWSGVFSLGWRLLKPQLLLYVLAALRVSANTASRVRTGL